ncbi:hypothetical protein A0H81_09619 [Grifola frondosa]|uniref:Ribonuclease H1 N-terminal domain-containing protein n=1 Tax=Grifola frondosa TaxID=5627 RepID=A0A1C7LZD6_GRIFR|nr:hypothetical protein A0H81_09619 [Grifola frondosa]
MARTNRNAKGGEPTSGSPTFTLSQLADALQLIIAQQAEERAQTQAESQDDSGSTGTSDATSDTSDTSDISLSTQETTASAEQTNDVSPGTPTWPVPRTPPPPAAEEASCPRPTCSWCYRHNTASTKVDHKGLPAAETGRSYDVGVIGVGVLATGHAIPIGAQGPAAAFTPNFTPTLPTGRQAVGVFEGWHNVSPLVTGVSYAIYQRYTSRSAAQAAFDAAEAAGTVAVLP